MSEKKWWEEELDYSTTRYDGYGYGGVKDEEETIYDKITKGKYSKGNGNGAVERHRPTYSSAWRDQLGSSTGWSTPTWSWSGGSSEEEKNRRRLNRIGKRLARTVNVVRNSNDGDKERDLSIAYSSKDKPEYNSPTSTKIVLNPDEVIKCKADEEDALLDALTGRVLMAQSMKKTASPRAWKEALMSKDNYGQELWKGLEMAVARGEVMKDWSGAGPYFMAHSERCSDIEELQTQLDNMPPSSELATKAIVWNMLHPTDKVNLPESYKDAVSEAIDKMREEHDSHDRFKICEEAAKILRRHFKDPESGMSPPSSGPGEGEGEGEGEGDGAGGGAKGGKDDKKKGKESDSKSPPPGVGGGMCQGVEGKFGVDDSLFGKMSSTMEAEELPEDIDMGNVGAETYELPDSVSENDSQFDCIHHIETKDPAVVKQYIEIVTKMRSQITAIRNALRFRNIDPGVMERGLKSGCLDDGSLDKLAMKTELNPAIWEQRNFRAVPKIVVGLLIDESGSMNGEASYLDHETGTYKKSKTSATKIEAARSVAIALQNALSAIAGVDVMVLGHTANCSASVGKLCEKMLIKNRPHVMSVQQQNPQETANGLLMKEYLTRRHGSHFGLAKIGAYMSNNLDGFAIKYSVDKMAKDYPEHKARMLFVISDGQPAGCCVRMDGEGIYRTADYGIIAGKEHMRSVCEYARQFLKVDVYGIGICNAYDKDDAEKMYGPGRGIVIGDVFDGLPILTSFLKQVTSRLT